MALSTQSKSRALPKILQRCVSTLLTVVLATARVGCGIIATASINPLSFQQWRDCRHATCFVLRSWREHSTQAEKRGWHRKGRWKRTKRQGGAAAAANCSVIDDDLSDESPFPILPASVQQLEEVAGSENAKPRKMRGFFFSATVTGEEVSLRMSPPPSATQFTTQSLTRAVFAFTLSLALRLHLLLLPTPILALYVPTG